ncbi:MAG: DsrE family protein [Pseudomonadota bacterium]
MTQKFLINCQNGANNVERATISFILAVTASKTAETAVFLSAEASRLCTRGGSDNLIAEGYESLKGLISDFVGNGGKIWLCPACAKAKSIGADDLIEGAEIAGAPKTMAFLASGAQILA